MSAKGTILFLGATGGCASAALTLSLKAGYDCIALVRTPSKLTSLLIAQGISESTLSSHLTIHAGNAHDVEAVKKALLIGSGPSAHLPSTIISGLGGAPKLQFSIWAPLSFVALDQPHICETAAATLSAALSDLYASNPHLSTAKPLLAFISTTGISRGPEDVPWMMRFLYHRILHGAHVDKRAMEDVFRGTRPSPFRAVIGVKPTLLTSGVGVGLEKIRVGREAKPELGYTISRNDVGAWIFERVVREEGRGWENEMASMTN